MEVTVKGRIYNLNGLRWTWGDWEDLEASEGITPDDISSGKVRPILSLVWWILRKINPEITRDDVRDLDYSDPIVQSMIQAINRPPADPKASSSSTSSPPPTDGIETT